MSIYKGGYILADISDTDLTEEQNLLPQELKDYISKFIKNENYTKEVLVKPIKLLAKVDGYYTLLTFNLIGDDYTELVSEFRQLEYCYNISIDNFLTLHVTTKIIQ